MMIKTLQASISEIEKAVVSQVKLRPEYQQLQSVSGIDQVLGLTIMLETAGLGRAV
jgi:transposase